MIVWLNLNSKQEVDELFERWKDTGAKIIEAVEDKPWNLRDFRVADWTAISACVLDSELRPGSDTPLSGESPDRGMCARRAAD